MKKIMIVLVLILLFSIDFKSANANYHAYQEVTFEHSYMKLLEDYRDSDFEDYYDELPKRRFYGFNIYKAFSNEKAYFIKETLFIVENYGDTAIDETVTFTQTLSVTTQFGASGGIKTKGSGTAKGFKLNLESYLDLDYEKTVKEVTEEKHSFKIKVDPNTRMTIQILGEAKVSNGVAKYHRFWFLAKKGGWEVFLVTTEYYYFLKERLDEE